MNKKAEKLPMLAPEHKEALAVLGARPEYKALERLFKIEESNIIVTSFKRPSSDPDTIRKKAWDEGRVYELRKIMKSFDDAKKKAEDLDENE